MNLRNIDTVKFIELSNDSSNKFVCLSEIAANQKNAIVDGPFGSSLKTSDYVEEGIPVLQGKNITGDSFRFFDIRYITNKKANELIRSKVEVGDILLVKIGSIGYAAEITDLNGHPYAIIPANLAKITIDKNKVEKNYLLNWLKTESVKLYFQQVASKTAQPALSLEKIKALPVYLPDLKQQKRIAAILDKAAEVKKKRELAIAKLDELAQSTFIEMFENDLNNATQTVSDFFEINSNRYETALVDEAVVPFIPMSAVSEKSKSVVVYEKRLFLDVKKGYTPIQKNDLIVAKITPCYENGKQAIVDKIESQFAYGSTEFHTFRSSNQNLVVLLHYYLTTKNVMRKGAASMKGAAGQKRVPDSFFRALPFLCPPDTSLSKFNDLMKKIAKQRGKLIEQLNVSSQAMQSLQDQVFTTEFTA